MKFRQIDPQLTEKNVIYDIARWHNETPRLWLEDYQPSEDDINETIERMMANDCYIGVAEEEKIVGFIWAEKQEDHALILSLYVDEEVREQKIGTYLKEALEAWCHITGISKIKTTVHSKNKKMITLNEKLGYEQKMIHMEKTL